jgi:hypothetical protein
MRVWSVTRGMECVIELKMEFSDPLDETRRRLLERRVYLDGLESNGPGDVAGQGDPASMRSWLSCRCIDGSFYIPSSSNNYIVYY